MIYAKFKENKGIFIDAPLLGGPADTAAGSAPCMVSGNKEDVDSVMNTLTCYATPINYMGTIGSAHTVKFAMNFTLGMLKFSLSID